MYQLKDEFEQKLTDKGMTCLLFDGRQGDTKVMQYHKCWAATQGC